MFSYVIFHPSLYDKIGDIIDRITILYYLPSLYDKSGDIVDRITILYYLLFW